MCRYYRDFDVEVVVRATLVKGPSSTLWGAKCGLCPHTVKAGESVVWKKMPNSSYAEDRLVFHTDCMAALVQRAPAGRPAGDARARAEAIRATAATTGDPFARPAAA